MPKISYQRRLKFISARILPKQNDVLNMLAKREHKPKQALIIEAIRQYLERKGYPHNLGDD